MLTDARSSNRRSATDVLHCGGGRDRRGAIRVHGYRPDQSTLYFRPVRNIRDGLELFKPSHSEQVGRFSRRNTVDVTAPLDRGGPLQDVDVPEHVIHVVGRFSRMMHGPRSEVAGRTDCDHVQRPRNRNPVGLLNVCVVDGCPSVRSTRADGKRKAVAGLIFQRSDGVVESSDGGGIRGIVDGTRGSATNQRD